MLRQLADNQRSRDERHEQILRAAASVFARKGLTATKITDKAAAAGVSHGLTYHYFASKEDIFRQLVTRAAKYRADHARSAPAGVPDDDLSGSGRMQ